MAPHKFLALFNIDLVFAKKNLGSYLLFVIDYKNGTIIKIAWEIFFPKKEFFAIVNEQNCWLSIISYYYTYIWKQFCKFRVVLVDEIIDVFSLFHDKKQHKKIVNPPTLWSLGRIEYWLCMVQFILQYRCLEIVIK